MTALCTICVLRQRGHNFNFGSISYATYVKFFTCSGRCGLVLTHNKRLLSIVQRDLFRCEVDVMQLPGCFSGLREGNVSQSVKYCHLMSLKTIVLCIIVNTANVYIEYTMFTHIKDKS